MFARTSRILALVAALILGGVATAEAQVVNGTLDGDGAPWSTVGCQDFSGFTGNAYQFGQTGCAGGIAQYFATVIGASYSVSFDAFTNSDNGFLEVRLDGNTVFFASPVGSSSWQTYTTASSVATSSSSYLEFLGNQPPSYQYIDNISVSVTSTPEPASMVLLATGLLGVAGFARRKRSA